MVAKVEVSFIYKDQAGNELAKVTGDPGKFMRVEQLQKGFKPNAHEMKEFLNELKRLQDADNNKG